MLICIVPHSILILGYAQKIDLGKLTIAEFPFELPEGTFLGKDAPYRILEKPPPNREKVESIN